MRNFATSKVIGEETIQFRSYDRCIITLQNVRHVPDSRCNLIFLGSIEGKYSVSVWKMILWKFLKRPMWYFSRTCLQCVYVAEFGGYCWWIVAIIGFKSDGCGTIIDYDDFELRCLVVPEGRFGLGRQSNPNRYSYGGANSHRSYVDQRNYWVIKFR